MSSLNRKMKLRTFAFAKSLMQRDSHVFASLTTTCLDVGVYELGFLGWRQVAFSTVPIDNLGDNFDQLETALLSATAGWRIKSQTNVSWVLPPDIVGVVPNTKGLRDGPELDLIFPFSRDQILVSKSLNGRDLGPSILWVHKDWVAVLQRISHSAGLQCCELFARAQLFTRSFPVVGVHGVLIDSVREESFLHIYRADRELVRSKSLGKVRTLTLDASFERELVSLGDNAASMYCAGSNLPLFQWEAGRGASESFIELPVKAPDEVLRALAYSLEQGVEIDSTYGGVVKTITSLSVLVVGLLLAILCFVSWHGYELKSTVKEGRASIRKDLSAYESAKTLRLEAVRFAKAIELKDKFTNQPESFKILADTLAALGPDATLMFFSQDGLNVRLAGGADSSRANAASVLPTTNFRDVKEIDHRDVQEAPNATFARRLVWNDPAIGALTAPPKSEAP